MGCDSDLGRMTRATTIRISTGTVKELKETICLPGGSKIETGHNSERVPGFNFGDGALHHTPGFNGTSLGPTPPTQ